MPKRIRHKAKAKPSRFKPSVRKKPKASKPKTTVFKKPIVAAKGKFEAPKTPSWLMQLLHPNISLKQSVSYGEQESKLAEENDNPFPSVVDLAYEQSKKEQAKAFFTDKFGRIRVMNFN